MAVSRDFIWEHSRDSYILQSNFIHKSHVVFSMHRIIALKRRNLPGSLFYSWNECPILSCIQYLLFKQKWKANCISILRIIIMQSLFPSYCRHNFAINVSTVEYAITLFRLSWYFNKGISISDCISYFIRNEKLTIFILIRSHNGDPKADNTFLNIL